MNAALLLICYFHALAFIDNGGGSGILVVDVAGRQARLD
jgi:hypothetical protein